MSLINSVKYIKHAETLTNSDIAMVRIVFMFKQVTHYMLIELMY